MCRGRDFSKRILLHTGQETCLDDKIGGGEGGAVSAGVGRQEGGELVDRVFVLRVPILLIGSVEGALEDCRVLGPSGVTMKTSSSTGVLDRDFVPTFIEDFLTSTDLVIRERRFLKGKKIIFLHILQNPSTYNNQNLDYFIEIIFI